MVDDLCLFNLNILMNLLLIPHQSPTMYEKDLKAYNATCIPSHRLMDRQQHADALHVARQLWADKYPDEPFDLPLDVTKSVESKAIERKLEYDLFEAVKRQQMFYYQVRLTSGVFSLVVGIGHRPPVAVVESAMIMFPICAIISSQVSLPHYRKQAFLEKAVERYKKFLKLKRDYPNRFFVPCYDFDLIWHAHQAHSREYIEYTTKYLGSTLSHDDSINDRAPGSKLNGGEAVTRTTWQEAYGESFARSGAMWRGDPPHTWMSRVPSGLVGARRMVSFKKGSFEPSTAGVFAWAFKVDFVTHRVGWGKAGHLG